MLQDPEKPYEEWESEVWAKTLAEAQAECESIANTTGLTDVLNVSQRYKNPSKSGNYLFICWFRTEKLEDESDSDD